MQDTDGLAVTFDDVIDAEADPGLLMIVQGLDDAYRARPVPDDVHLRVERALSGSPRRGRRGPRLLTLFQARKAGLRNLKIATASAALLLLVTGAGFGATSVLQKVYDMNAGTHQILTQNLGKEVNETRVAGGFSVELKRAYADSNKIVLGVTLSAPPQRHINSMVLFGTYDFADRMRLNTPPVLSDDHGQRFPGGLAPMGTGVQDGASGALLEYAPTGLQPGQPLLLHLHASAIEVTEDLPSTAAANAHEPRCDEVQGTLCDFTVRGNFSFDFSVPVDPGLVLSLNQASTVNHVALTLVRVTTGYSGTTLLIRGAGPSAHVMLSVNGKSYEFQRPVGLAVPERWTRLSEEPYVTDADLQGQAGVWTVEVRSGTPLPKSVAPDGTSLSGGPWVFQFSVPGHNG